MALVRGSGFGSSKTSGGRVFQERYEGTLRQASLSRGAPHTFLKSAHALFEHPKSFTLSLPSSTPCFHRHLKQIAAPAGPCYLRKHPASSEPAGKGAERRIQKREKEVTLPGRFCAKADT